jgi:hypothetical protein
MNPMPLPEFCHALKVMCVVDVSEYPMMYVLDLHFHFYQHLYFFQGGAPELTGLLKEQVAIWEGISIGTIDLIVLRKQRLMPPGGSDVRHFAICPEVLLD